MTPRTFIFFLLLCSGIFAYALPDDSLKQKVRVPTSVRFLTESSFARGIPDYQYPDTALAGKSETNPALEHAWNYLGTNGSASHPQVFQQAGELYSRPGIGSYDLYLWRADSVKYFRTNKRYTRIDYHQGNFKEQQIRVLHTQNITRQWNAGLDFNRHSVRDFMQNSKIFYSQFSLFTWYESPGKHYNLFAHANLNAIRNQLNGGLTNDSLFENANITNLGLKGLAVRLTDAQQRLSSRTFYISQYFDPGIGGKQSGDSLPVRKSNSLFRIHHAVSYESSSLAYEDHVADSSYYSHFYYAAASTDDSIHYYDLRNRGEILLPVKDSMAHWFRRNIALTAGIEQQWFKYHQRRDTSWTNLSLQFSGTTLPGTARYVISVTGNYIFEGHDRSAYNGEARLASPEFGFGRFLFGASTILRNQDLLYQYNETNHFYWRNDFSKTASNSLSFRYDLDRYHLSAQIRYHRVQHLVLVNEQALPQQMDNTISITQIELRKNFRWRSLHLDNFFVYQKSSDALHVPLPAWVAVNALYIEKFHFRKALLAQYGIRLHYRSSYYSEAFMPATGLFYLQEQQKTGGYPLLDVYITGKIKTATLFLDFENAGDGLVGKRYMLTPDYPQPGMVVKFGVIWRFFDQ